MSLIRFTVCLPLLVFLWTVALTNMAYANPSLKQQRELYQSAQQALQKNQITRFQQLERHLLDYPLYPYLQYEYLIKRLDSVNSKQLHEFINGNEDLPKAAALRSRWLKTLARKKQWQTFLDQYRPQSDPALQCLYLQARIDQGLSDNLLQDIRQQWLSGKSLPNECDPAFKILYTSHYMSDELVWQRIRLSMQEGNVRLANYLGKKLSPAMRDKLSKWIELHHSPARHLAKLPKQDNEYTRERLLYGVKRLSRRHVSEAVRHWSKIQAQYRFTEEDIALVNRQIALHAVKLDHPDSLTLLGMIPADYVNRPLLTARLKLALQKRAWQTLLSWLDGVPADDEAIKHPWYYWKARALQETGDELEAERVFLKIANERDYYGFLAADNLQEKYGFNHIPIKSAGAIRDDLYSMPAIARIKELLALDERVSAIREWQSLLQRLDDEQLQEAALLASEWNWHDRVIVTLGQGKYYDDLKLRFPLNYEKQLQWYSNKNSLDLAWVFALVRAESAFVETARSPAGALGLMQVMPATGKMTARRLGWKSFSKKMLLDADKNIPIGSAYLKQMLDRFNGNMILATAAYNAGPHRVDQWLPARGCMEPDVWIEQIPFMETRRYVKRILYYANIYDWRMQKTIVSIRKRMTSVSSNKTGLAASFSCRGQMLSLN